MSWLGESEEGWMNNGELNIKNTNEIFIVII